MSSRGFQPSTVIVYLDTNDPQTFSGSLSGVDSQKKKLYKQNRVIFCDYLPSSSRIQCSTFVAYIPISACHSLLLTHSHSWIQCYCYYQTSIKKRAIIMPSAQALPFINQGLRQDYYRTILPNLSYPYCPNQHILCSGSLTPLLFSVSQAFFPSCYEIGLLFFSLRKPHVLRLQPPLLSPAYKLVILF